MCYIFKPLKSKYLVPWNKTNMTNIWKRKALKKSKPSEKKWTFFFLNLVFNSTSAQNLALHQNILVRIKRRLVTGFENIKLNGQIPPLHKLITIFISYWPPSTISILKRFNPPNPALISILDRSRADSISFLFI